MVFDPLTLLTLKYGGRSVAVFREHCLHHKDVLDVARRTFASLQHVSANDLILMAPIPGYPNPKPVELSPEVWTVIYRHVHKVTIVLESETSSAGDDWTDVSKKAQQDDATACSSPVSSPKHHPQDLPDTPTSSTSTLASPPLLNKPPGNKKPATRKSRKRWH